MKNIQFTQPKQGAEKVASKYIFSREEIEKELAIKEIETILRDADGGYVMGLYHALSVRHSKKTENRNMEL